MPVKTPRTGLILAVYSFFITLLLMAAALIFVETAAPPQNSGLPQILFVAGEQQIVESVQTGSFTFPIGSASTTAIKLTTIEEYYRGEFFKYFPVMMISLFLIVTAGTFTLWRTLNRQGELRARALAAELHHIEENPEAKDEHPVLQRAYGDVREKIEGMTTDYLRLSLYIAHEQKNALSLLRARLQLAGNAELSAEIDRVANGIDDVLTLSASEGMKHDEIVDAALVCADVCDEYRKIYSRISFTFDELANSQIRGRELWIHRAVSNLVDNAIKYGNSSEIKVEVKNKKGSVIITVADEGIGIEENKLEKIFENRYRINELKKDGYGIGLSLVHHVCELCGGAAHVESQKGKGSIFYMVFPQAFTEN